MEQASKSAHGHLINDPAVKKFLTECTLPKSAGAVNLAEHKVFPLTPVNPNPIRHIVAVDSGYTEIPVQANFPSSTLAFFQFGALTFSIADLESLAKQPFIDPEDMAKLKRIERLKLALPVRNLALKDQPTLTTSVRVALYRFFAQPRDDSTLLETLRWFLFEEYRATPVASYQLARCPACDATEIDVVRDEITADGRFPCSKCGNSLFLIDVFRLHEAITDDGAGAGGILGYVTTLLEQFVMVHFLRLILRQDPTVLGEILFIKDGPLAFFGQTANMCKKMRALLGHLLEHHSLFMVGLEKSGAFVDHAAEVAQVLKDGSALILDSDYIYRYIIPGDPSTPYGRNTYYSAKLIFKTRQAGVHVVTVPTVKDLIKPTKTDLPNLDVILTNIEKLRCDMYDDALIPVALVNKLVSLANHPSSKILQRFAIHTVGQGL